MYQQSFHGIAGSWFLQFGVGYNIHGIIQIGAGLNIDMAITLASFDNRNTRVLNNPLNQIPAASGQHNVNPAPGGKYFVYILMAARLCVVGKLYSVRNAAASLQPHFNRVYKRPV
jgi:hypothetical protein